MKIKLLLIIAALAPLAVADEIKLLNGTVVKGDITRAEPDGLVIMTGDGITKIDFALLPPELQKKYGFDSDKAAQFAAQVAAAAQQRAQAVAAVQAHQAAADAMPNMSEIKLNIEKSGLSVEAKILQSTKEGARVTLHVYVGRAAGSALDTDTRMQKDGGEGFVYGLEGLENERRRGLLYPCGYYHYVTVMGAERTVPAYALTVESALAHTSK